jgi:hypothetical protein
MVEWVYAELITRKQCHERQYRMSYQDYNTGSPYLDYSRKLVRLVREIRQANPTYSAEKIRSIPARTMSSVPSVPTLGRLNQPGASVFQGGNEPA